VTALTPRSLAPEPVESAVQRHESRAWVGAVAPAGVRPSESAIESAAKVVAGCIRVM
jgi:hypothetical protein